MNDLLKKLPVRIQFELKGLIYSGEKAAAAKRYRETVNCESKTAKQAIIDIEIKLRTTHPS